MKFYRKLIQTEGDEENTPRDSFITFKKFLKVDGTYYKWRLIIEFPFQKLFRTNVLDKDGLLSNERESRPHRYVIIFTKHLQPFEQKLKVQKHWVYVP